MTMRNPDVEATNHGSIYTFLPLTALAQEWITEHVVNDAQWFGPSLVVEHHYAADLIRGMQEDGLIVI